MKRLLFIALCLFQSPVLADGLTDYLSNKLSQYASEIPASERDRLIVEVLDPCYGPLLKKTHLETGLPKTTFYDFMWIYMGEAIIQIVRSAYILRDTVSSAAALALCKNSIRRVGAGY